MTPKDSLLNDFFVSLDTDSRFTKAVMAFRDGSRLYFCHKVDDRWARALGPAGNEDRSGISSQLVNAIQRFRLNAKHLEIWFADGSRWERKLSRGP